MQSLHQAVDPAPSLSHDQTPTSHNVLPRPATHSATRACRSNENHGYTNSLTARTEWLRNNAGCQDQLEPQEIPSLVSNSSNNSMETVLASQTPEYEQFSIFVLFFNFCCKGEILFVAVLA